MSLKCKLCESEKQTALFNLNKYDLVRCSDCGLVFIEKMMPSLDAIAYYDRAYQAGSDGETPSDYHTMGEEIKLAEANSRLDRIGGGETLLDVGCGLGYFIKAASQRGIKAQGIDISENAVSYAKKQGLDARKGDLLEISDFQEGSYDVITFWASLEHLYEPFETLKKAHSLLRPGGMVVIETVDIESLIAKFFKENWRMIKADHNFYFSSRTLNLILEKIGFSVVRTEWEGLVEALISTFKMRKYALSQFSRGDRSAKRRGGVIKERINAIAGKLRLGDVIVVYATK